jgi:hypothetical protein
MCGTLVAALVGGDVPRNGISGLGHKQTLALHYTMSALPPKADISGRNWNVHFGSLADIDRVKLDVGLRPMAALRWYRPPH